MRFFGLDLIDLLSPINAPVGPKRIIELGFEDGAISKLMLTAWAELVLIGVEDFPDGDRRPMLSRCRVADDDATDRERLWGLAKENISQFIERCVLTRMPPGDILSYQPRNSVDAIVYGGGRVGSTVADAIADCGKKVRVGGVICGFEPSGDDTGTGIFRWAKRGADGWGFGQKPAMEIGLQWQ